MPVCSPQPHRTRRLAALLAEILEQDIRRAQDTESNPDPHYLTVAEVAEQLRTCERTIRNRLRDGTLPGRRVGRRWLVDRVELARHLKGGQP
jgi:excisionase family DNA binding protein